MKWLIHSSLFLAVLALPCNAQEVKLTTEAARKLIPEAAGMSNADCKKLAEKPGLDAIKSKSLSLVLLALDPEIASKNPDAAKEFRYIGDKIPPVVQIAVAMSLSKNKGYATYIQPKFITDCTCESTTERAEGVVTFKNNLYEGRIAFVVQATKNGWIITEFSLPQHKIKVVRKGGIWKQEVLAGK